MEVCIVPKRSFLSCSTTRRQNRGTFNFTSLNDAILQLPRLSAYSIIALITRGVVASRRFRLLAASTPTSLVSYGVVRLPISPSELHCRKSFPFCLELLLLPLFYELDLSFSHLSVSVVRESSVLTQPENSAADRQISMIIVIRAVVRAFLIEPSMITAAVRDALESTLYSWAWQTHIITSL